MKVDLTRPGDRLSGLRRCFRVTLRRNRGFVDAAPLVDVALLVFLFFLVQSSFVVQPGIRIDLPAGVFADAASYTAQVITISQHGMIFHNDERTTLDRLGPALRQSVQGQRGATLRIEADGQVDHRTLVEIYGLARDAGITDVVLATRLPAAEK